MRESGLFLCHTSYMDEIAGQACNEGWLKISFSDVRVCLVTVENIKETRYSRNPRISRVLTEFGWVRELNEGVKRIYADMKNFFLEDPVYNEPGQAVRLTLKNNIVMRNIRRKDKAMKSVGEEMWSVLDDLERRIVVFMASNTEVSRAQLERHTGKSIQTVNNRLKNLLEKGFIKSNGNKNDPKHPYSLVFHQRD